MSSSCVCSEALCHAERPLTPGGSGQPSLSAVVLAIVWSAGKSVASATAQISARVDPSPLTFTGTCQGRAINDLGAAKSQQIGWGLPLHREGAGMLPLVTSPGKRVAKARLPLEPPP